MMLSYSCILRHCYIHNLAQLWLYTLCLCALVLNSSYAAEFNFGSYHFERDHEVIFQHESDFLANSGTISLKFTTFTDRGRQGLFSKDARNFVNGGHIGLWINNRSVVARLQSADQSFEIQTPQIVETYREYRVELEFGATGIQLFVDGELLASESYTGGLGATSGGTGNEEPIVIGALANTADQGQANNLKDRFNGSIRDIVFINDAEQISSPNPLPIINNSSEQPMAMGNVTFQLVNRWNNEFFANQKIELDSYADGENPKRLLELTTDENGKVRFSVPTAQYRFEGRSTVSNKRIVTEDFNGLDGGNIEIGIAPLQLTLSNRLTGSPIADQKVTVHRFDEDKLKHIGKQITDANGQAVFELEGIGQGTVYELQTRYFNGITSHSAILENTGPFNWVLGSTKITLVDGSSETKTPLVDHQVSFYRLKEGTNKRFAKLTSDDSGIILVDLSDLSESNSVELQTKSPLANGQTYNYQITKQGDHEFVVGDKAINISLTDARTNQPIVETSVVLERKSNDGKFKHIRSTSTDQNGTAKFDIERSDEPKIYRVKSSPFSDFWIYSSEFNEPSNVELAAGKTLVTVKDGVSENQPPLIDQKIQIKIKNLETEKSRHYQQARTDQSGIIRIDLEPLQANEVYYLSTKSPSSQRWQTSDPITTNEDIEFVVGVPATVVSVKEFIGGAPVADIKVIAEQLDEEGNWKHRKNMRTDETGNASFYLDGLRNEKTYRFKAKKYLGYAYSQSFTQPGEISLNVGTLPVTLLNKTDRAVLANIKVRALRQQDDGSLKQVASGRTDEAGKIIFDLLSLGEKRYWLRADKPLPDLKRAYSPLIYQQGVYEFLVDPEDSNEPDTQSPTLVLNHPIADNIIVQPLVLQGYVNDDESLDKLAISVTSSSGAVHSTTIEQPATGDWMYSVPTELIAVDTALDIKITATDINGNASTVSKDVNIIEDITPPELLISSHSENDYVETSGTLLFGQVFDDVEVQQFSLSIEDEINGQVLTNKQIDFDPISGSWEYEIPADLFAQESKQTLFFSATDTSNNTLENLLTLTTVYVDVSPPKLTVSSHIQGQAVSSNGFTLSGTVNDDVKVAAITLTVTDDLSGILLENQPVPFDPADGSWEYAVNGDLLTIDRGLHIDFTAIDTSNNAADSGFNLTTKALLTSARQLIQRATFGLTPELEQRIESIDGETWLDTQLSPLDLDDSKLMALVADMPIESIEDLRARELTYAIYSERQLQQVMAWFWENHFSTYYRSHGEIAFEEHENSRFRELALGDFRDLLGVSAKSPAMLYYLDNAVSSKESPNENYAREIMELHTLGVDGGYSAEDIVDLARILTGWQVENGMFVFNAEDHDDESKQFLGQTILPNGVQEGELALDLLAQHPSTASFICSKLITFFVDDEPVQSLQQSCTSEFLGSNGNIALVLRHLLSSDEFNSHITTKVKTPLEIYVSSIRALNAEPDMRVGSNIITTMGMPLFERPAPDGYSDYAEDWINVDAMVQRVQFANNLAFENIGGYVDVMDLFSSRNVTSAEQVISTLSRLLHNDRVSDLERQQLLEILNETQPFSLENEDSEIKLRRAIATIMSYPGYQYQ